MTPISAFPADQVHSYAYLCANCGLSCRDWTILKEGNPALIRKLCDRCDEEAYQARKLSRDAFLEQERRAHFSQICPEIYRESQKERLPRQQLNLILRYTPHERGLLFMGDSRKGKTRCGWVLMEKLVMLGHRIEALSEVEYSIKMKSFKAHEGFRNHLCSVPILFLDDLGHVAAGQKHLEELYHVVETRTAHKRPIICTTQFSGDEMNDRSGRNKTMAAIINRLREFCDIIDFNK